jgi:hypothetical protein
MKIICFDLDGVLCSTKKNLYKDSKPIIKNIKFVNYLYDQGFYIKIYTSRFMGRNKDNIRKANLQGFQFTSKQLKKWKIKYHKLIMGKISYDIFVDDKSLFFKKNWAKKNNFIKKANFF